MPVGRARTPARSAGPRFRWWPLLLLLALAAAIYAMGWAEYLSFETLRAERATLQRLVADHALLAPLVFLLIYALAVGLSVPGAAVLTVCGGFLFGIILGTVLCVFGATIGAVIVFLIARTSLGEPLRARAGPWFARMGDAFARDALSYLLVLRLIPVFPFWLVNLVPAFMGVRLSTYVTATFFGIIPGTLVYASLGSGLGSVLDAGDTPDLGLLFEAEILLPLAGLALFALLPVLYRRLRPAVGADRI